MAASTSGIALANLSGVLSAVVIGSFLSGTDQQAAYSLAFIALALLIGLTGGIFNGLLISRLNITPILCTLGTQMLFTGLAVVVSEGRAVAVGTPDLLPPRSATACSLGVPISFLIFIGVAAFIAALLKFTPSACG